jgi:hypothetical protein
MLHINLNFLKSNVSKLMSNVCENGNEKPKIKKYSREIPFQVSVLNGMSFADRWGANKGELFKNEKSLKI